ncbi:MAG: hypothetical protein MK101_00360 [Phycisphaerales bacterium]|nr:hypothetical protein [Phycisphaerales bacterium]
MHEDKRQTHTLSEAQLRDVRRAIASIDADITTARTNRAAEQGDTSVRRLATRRSDMPWWMKRAG